jgi:hypothetical protein
MKIINQYIMISKLGLTKVYELEGKRYLKEKIISTNPTITTLEPISQAMFDAMKKESQQNSKELFGK